MVFGVVGGEFRPLAWQLFRGRWFMLFVSFLVMAASGSTYIFGLYSDAIKSSLGYDQTTLNWISFFKDTGTNVGILSGLINEVAPPWVVMSIASAMNFAGYFMIWLAVKGKVTKPHVWQMCLYITLGANSQCFSNTGALVTSLQNFPQNRGVVIGLINGFLGLSGAIVTQLYHAIYGEDSKGLILLIACLPSAIYALSVPIIRVIKVVRQGNENELKVFYRFLYVSLALAGYLTFVIIMQKALDFSQAEYAGSSPVVLILLFSPIALVMKQEINIRKAKKHNATSSFQIKISVEKPPLVESEPEPLVESAHSCWSTMFEPPKRGDDFTILQALVSGDMFILFVAAICGIGGTTTVIDNLGQIGSALGYSTAGISTFISLVSILSFLGRVGSGFGSEILLKRYKLPRTLMLTVILFISCIGHLLIAFPFSGSVYAASMIIGFCLGAQWFLVFTIISEIFGLKYYSTLSNFGSLASPIGSYLLNVRVVGDLYDKEAEKQLSSLGRTRASGQDLTCNGIHCYRVAFIIIAAITLLATLVSLVLVWRTREFYKSDIYLKFRDREASVVQEMETYVAVVRNGDNLTPTNTTTSPQPKPSSRLIGAE